MKGHRGSPPAPTGFSAIRATRILRCNKTKFICWHQCIISVWLSGKAETLFVVFQIEKRRLLKCYRIIAFRFATSLKGPSINKVLHPAVVRDLRSGSSESPQPDLASVAMTGDFNRTLIRASRLSIPMINGFFWTGPLGHFLVSIQYSALALNPDICSLRIIGVESFLSLKHSRN